MCDETAERSTSSTQPPRRRGVTAPRATPVGQLSVAHAGVTRHGANRRRRANQKKRGKQNSKERAWPEITEDQQHRQQPERRDDEQSARDLTKLPPLRRNHCRQCQSAG